MRGDLAVKWLSLISHLGFGGVKDPRRSLVPLQDPFADGNDALHSLVEPSLDLLYRRLDHHVGDAQHDVCGEERATGVLGRFCKTMNSCFLFCFLANLFLSFSFVNDSLSLAEISGRLTWAQGTVAARAVLPIPISVCSVSNGCQYMEF